MATYHHGNLKAALLREAGDILEKEGPSGLSVREAARQAGVSHSAPYRHFPDRESLLAALAGEALAELERTLDGVSGRKLGEAYVRFALAHPQRFRLMSASGQAATLRERLSAAFSGLGVDPALAAAAAWSLMHGFACLALEGHLPKDEDFASRVIGALRFAQRSA